MFFVPFLLLSATFYAELFGLPEWVLSLIGQFALYGSGFVFALGTVLFLWKFYLWRTSFYLVTNKRLFAVARRGLFAEDNRQTSLSNIQDVSAQINGIQAILYGFGDVVVQLWTDDVPMILRQIPRAKSVQQIIMQQVLGSDAGMGGRGSTNEKKLQSGDLTANAGSATNVGERRRGYTFLRQD